MTSMYLSPLLAGSRARSCGAGDKAEGEPRGGAAAGAPWLGPALPSLPAHTRTLSVAPARPRPAPPAQAAPRSLPPPPLPAQPLSLAFSRLLSQGRARYLHESLYSAFGYVQIGGAQMGALVHGGGRVYQEE